MHQHAANAEERKSSASAGMGLDVLARLNLSSGEARSAFLESASFIRGKNVSSFPMHSCTDAQKQRAEKLKSKRGSGRAHTKCPKRPHGLTERSEASSMCDWMYWQD